MIMLPLYNMTVLHFVTFKYVQEKLHNKSLVKLVNEESQAICDIRLTCERAQKYLSF
jgi:hypothetical protein